MTNQEDTTATEERPASSVTSSSKISPVIPDATSADADDLLTDEEKIELGLMEKPEGWVDDDDAPEEEGAAEEDDTPDDTGDDDFGEEAAAKGSDTVEAAQIARDDDAKAAAAEPRDIAGPIPVVDPDAEARVLNEMKAAQKDYDDGELTDDEYDARKSELDQQYREAVKQNVRNEQAFETWNESWKANVTDYLAEVPEFAPGGPHAENFDRFVRAVNGSTDPAIQAMTQRERLIYGHKMYKIQGEAHGVEVPDVPTKRKASAAPAEKGGLPPKPAGKREPVQTLAKMPADTVETGNGGRFAELDRIADSDDPEAYERALGRLSEDDRVAYLSQ
ncbi:hypothetical protein [Salipiger sp.]|uniref:hypothetical protein n=1 Tax=Salipiger sp. TaxID=2078585 RepID=UPI003A9825FB